MAKSVKSVQKTISKLEKEIEKHKKKLDKAKVADKFVHRARMEAAETALKKAKADLILAVAEASRKAKGK